MWNKIKRDLRERFWNYDTLKGIVGFICSSIVLYQAINHVNYVILYGFACGGFYFIVHHFYEMFANPIKKKIKEEELILARKLGFKDISADQPMESLHVDTSSG